MANKKTYVLLFMLLGVIFFSAFALGSNAWSPNGIDYPPRKKGEVTGDSENNDFNITISGDADFNSITDGVGSQYYGVEGGTTPVNWDAFIPDDYEYENTTITIAFIERFNEAFLLGSPLSIIIYITPLFDYNIEYFGVLIYKRIDNF